MALTSTEFGAHGAVLSSKTQDSPISSPNSSLYKPLKPVQSEEFSNSCREISIAIGQQKVKFLAIWLKSFAVEETILLSGCMLMLAVEIIRIHSDIY